MFLSLVTQVRERPERFLWSDSFAGNSLAGRSGNVETKSELPWRPRFDPLGRVVCQRLAATGPHEKSRAESAALCVGRWL